MNVQELVEDLKTNLFIDKNALDDVLVEQPSLIFKIGEQYSYAVDRRDALKDQLARTLAKLSEEIRELSADVKPKITEGCINNRAIQKQEYIEVADEFRKAKMEAAILGELKESFVQRSFMVKDLVNLYVNEYFMNKSTSIEKGSDSDNGTQARKDLSETRKKTTRRRTKTTD